MTLTAWPRDDMTAARLSTLGQRPKHWAETRCKFLLFEVDDRSVGGEEERLSVSHITGVTARNTKKITMFEADSYAGHKLCQAGDVVINTMWAWMGGLGVAGTSGIVSPAYGVYRPFDVGAFNPLFLDRLLRSPAFVAEYTKRSTGIRGSRLRLYPHRFLDIPILIPSRDEQDRIAATIYEREEAVHTYVTAKRRQAQLFQEERIAIVDAAMAGAFQHIKTGVSRRNEMPAHWDVRRLKYLCSHHSSMVDPTDGKQIVALENVEAWTGRHVRSNPEVTGKVKEFERGDVLFSRLRPYLAKVLLAPAAGQCVGEFLVLRPDDKLLLSEFLALKLRSSPLIDRVTKSTNGAKMPRADWDFIGTIPIHFPSLTEQRQLAQEVTRRCALIDAALARIDTEVDLALEYMRSLTESLVTGTLEVSKGVSARPTSLLTPLTAMLLHSLPDNTGTEVEDVDDD